MRVLLVAGINDLMKGGTLDSVTNSILQLKNTIDCKNSHHPGVMNELVVATLFNPLKLTWFPDAGPLPQVMLTGWTRSLPSTTGLLNSTKGMVM